jgi:hypothetical protein
MFLSTVRTRPRTNLHQTRRPRPRFLPRLEGLEERTCPSTLTVRTTADSGAGSLRDTIAAAAPGDTIVFDHRLDGQTIALTSGQLTITEDVSIVGPGAGELTISGSGLSRVFTVLGGATASLTGLKVAGGLADQGGGILNAGNLSLLNVTVAGDQAVGDSATTGLGGGVYNQPAASLTATACTFCGNQVIGGPGIGFGGGLMNAGTATVLASSFVGNTAIGGLAGYGAGGAINQQNDATLTVSCCAFAANQALPGLTTVATGGAIDSEVGTTLAISDSTFSGNSAVATSTNPSLALHEFAAGGALLTFAGTLSVSGCRFAGNVASSTGFAGGGAIENQLSPATVSASTFTANLAQGRQGASSAGGAVDDIFFSTMTLTGCRFSANQAVAGDQANGVNTFGQAQGGAVRVSRSALAVSDCTLSDNLAQGGAACINSGAPTPDLAFVGSAFGGGIYGFRGSSITIADSTLRGNAAIAQPSGAGPGAFVAGGAVVSDLNGSLTVSDTLFQDNWATGGAGAAGGEGGSALGGAVANLYNSSAAFTACRFIANQAVGGSGGAGAVGGTSAGGAISNGPGFGLLTGPDHSPMTLAGCLLAGNVAAGGAGGLGAAGGNGIGGGIFLGFLNGPTGPTLDVSGSRIVGNLAVGGSGGNGAGGGNGLGGGLYAAAGTSACFEDSAVLGNLAAGGAAGPGGSAGQGIGGGLYIASGATVGGTNTAIAGNLATTSDDDVFGTFNSNC